MGGANLLTGAYKKKPIDGTYQGQLSPYVQKYAVSTMGYGPDRSGSMATSDATRLQDATRINTTIRLPRKEKH